MIKVCEKWCTHCRAHCFQLIKLVKSVIIHPSCVHSLPLRFTKLLVLSEDTIWYDIVATQKCPHCEQDLANSISRYTVLCNPALIV